jgi:class 3 adenylate cyclase
VSNDLNTNPTYFAKDIRFIADAFALIYDLEAFSQFANQPDAARYVPRVLNIVASVFTDAIAGGLLWWEHTSEDYSWPPVAGLLQRKFLGDGELLIFENAAEPNVVHFLNRFFNIQNFYGPIRERIEEIAPFSILPTGIRIGIARGSLYELVAEQGKTREYIGVCINLASRLQNYCPPLRFIASARSELPKDQLLKHDWQRVYATDIKGFEPEAVIVTKGALQEVGAEERARRFSETRPVRKVSAETSKQQIT